MARLRYQWPALLAALGFLTAAVLPAPAGGDPAPSTASFTAQDYAWQATGTGSGTVTVAVGATVSFGYPSGASTHNVDFGSGPAPTSCTQSAPAAPGAVPPLPSVPTGPGWSGTCTFDSPGTYTFHCDLHPFMTGTIVVGTSSTTTSSSTSATSPATSASTTTASLTTTSSSTTAPAAGGPPPNGIGVGAPGAAPSPLAGTAHRAIAIPGRQRGRVLRGSILVSPAGAGGSAEVDVFVSPAQLAGGGRARSHAARMVRVGHVVRRSLRPGRWRFAVPVGGAARRALHRRGRLAVTVAVTVRSPRGPRVAATRAVLVRA